MSGPTDRSITHKHLSPTATTVSANPFGAGRRKMHGRLDIRYPEIAGRSHFMISICIHPD